MQAQNFSTTHVLSSFSLERIELTEKLFDVLIPVLNQVHESNYSDRFWKLVIKDYVNSVISKKEVLSSHVLTSKPESEPTNSFTLPTLQARIRIQAIRFARYWRSRANEEVIKQKLNTEHNLTLSLPDLPIVQQELGNPLPTYYPFLWKTRNEKRKRVNAIADKYEDVYSKNIIRQLPGFVVEYFDGLVDGIVLAQPEKKSFHVHNFHSLYNALLVALYVEHGAKLYWYQHGGYYGEMVGHNSHYFEAMLSDRFRTWGWKIRENDEPWKAYRLEKFKKAYDAAVSTQECLLLCSPRINRFNREYFESTVVSLLASIDKKRYKNIVIRPRPGYKEKTPRAQFNFLTPSEGLTIDDAKRPIIDFVKEAVLVIQLTHPSTNFFECIYIDKPVMSLLHNEQPTDVVKPYYDFLLEAGVFHITVESMAKQLTGIDIASWWASVISTDMYKKFKNEFAKSTSNK